ncbi:MAG: flagellar type III secretion system pore protein FliP [Planctomycetota bacterium]
MRRLAKALLLPLALVAALAAPARAQAPLPPPAAAQAPAAQAPGAQAPQGGGNVLSLQIGDPSQKRLTSTVEIVLILTILTLAPSILLTLTSFTRIVIVLSFMKRAMSVQEMPPSLVVTGLSVFLTIFIMKPVLQDLHEQALVPYQEERIGFEEAGSRAATIMGDWLMRQTRVSDLELMYDISRQEMPPREELKAKTPFHLLVPAFVISEIKTAFQMGFVLFLPFLVIDIVISSLLISMGMFTLPPIVISTPFKILLFVLVDGWNLVLRSAIESFYA